MAVQRRTVDLSGYPDLVVVYLGMRVNALAGLKTLLGFGPKIERSHKAMPDGLLLHENYVISLIPPHVGMRQYWRDFGSLEAWTRGGMFSARKRLVAAGARDAIAGEEPAAVIPETDLSAQ